MCVYSVCIFELNWDDLDVISAILYTGEIIIIIIIMIIIVGRDWILDIVTGKGRLIGIKLFCCLFGEGMRCVVMFCCCVMFCCRVSLFARGCCVCFLCGVVFLLCRIVGSLVLI